MYDDPLATALLVSALIGIILVLCILSVMVSSTEDKITKLQEMLDDARHIYLCHVCGEEYDDRDKRASNKHSNCALERLTALG